MSRYPMSPGENPEDPEVIDKVAAFALEDPMPKDLREQIANWIEPETLNCELKHRDVMACIDIAWPLIRAHMEDLLW